MNNKSNNILVCGSLVYDRIMDFPGRFRDHILPDKIHVLNVSFAINKLKESFGGTAGNIAYNLSLLGERPIILGLAGNDFFKYEQWLKRQNIDISLVKKDRGELTASAYIMTDKDDNQIAGFYQGPLNLQYCRVAKKNKDAKIAIIAPEFKDRMVEYAKIYKQLKIPYIFDPGQQITSLTSRELKEAVAGAKVVIGNDYEIQLILNKIKMTLKQLGKKVELLVITRGSKGSEIYFNNRKIKIPPAKPRNICDPTGAGDAYRAGLIKGLLLGWPLEKVGRLAGLVAVYAVEKYGAQAHRFSWAGLRKRYKENFNEPL